ncbi:MAG: diadenylate cyclase [Deltaproteobacteria bacterium]|nr:diadenylate cyclase [Deltaproteobacteria bacterium]
MHLFSIITNLRVQDILDILFLTVIVYYLYNWFWGTKAFKALVGLLALGIVFTLARFWGLFLTTWVFQILWQVLIVLIIILFQSEIRQVLERVNPLHVIGLRTTATSADWIPGFAASIFSMAGKKIGALIILERMDFVEEMITGGIPLEGEPGPEVLMSIFQKDSPLHDGALLLSKGRVTRVGCYLPLSSAEGLPKKWGTRHRAALGLSERCDAWIVVISEERGEVSMARDGKMHYVRDIDKLTSLVREALAPTRPRAKGWYERIVAPVIHRWPVKLGALCLVFLVWLLLAGQQNFEVTLRVPLELRNLPAAMEVVEPVNPEVEITVHGVRKDASTLNRRNVHAEIDLSTAKPGSAVFRIRRDRIVLPNDRIEIVRVKPPAMEFKLRERSTKDQP